MGRKEEGKMLDRFTREEGQGMVEYGLIIALVAIIVIVALMTMGQGVGNIFSTIVSSL